MQQTVFRCTQLCDRKRLVFYWNILEETLEMFFGRGTDYTLEFGPYTIITPRDIESYGDWKVGSYQANSI